MKTNNKSIWNSQTTNVVVNKMKTSNGNEYAILKCKSIIKAHKRNS